MSVVAPERPPASIAAGLVDELRAALAPDRVHTGATELGLYKRDASNIEGRAGVICFPLSTAEVQACVRIAVAHDTPFVARGSGTGLTGGATPFDGAVVIATTKMNHVLSVDTVNRLAWVEPGVLNLDLSREVARHGLHFAPDPSSQQSCSIGGNVANNSGGPHCLADGVTENHVVAIEVVLADGSLTVLGGEEPEPRGYDLRGVFVGSEGMFGIATKVCVRLTQTPPAVRTMLFDFATVEAGAQTVSAIIAAGMVPAALEMMDQLCTTAVEGYINAGLPVDAAAILLVEVDGLPHGVEADVARIVEIARAHGTGGVRIAQDDAERLLLWKGRKTAFGAIARIKPNYYLHDTVVPRRRLPEVLREVYAIAERYDLLVMNVFHAGDGNLHPLLVFDKREPGIMERVHAAGEEIVRFSVSVGGVLSGEHGIGVEKRDLMPVMFAPPDLAAQAAVRRAFDPLGFANPNKVLPTAAACGDVQHVPAGAWVYVDLAALADEVGSEGAVTISGLATRGGPVPGVRCVGAPSGIESIQADEMIASCGAGTAVAALEAALAEVGQRVALPAYGTVGGALAVGQAGIRRLGDGPVRNTLLQARDVSAAGEVVKAGGPTVKNVSGFDVCRLLVGSRGTLGFLGEVILRTRPLPAASQWFTVPASEPFAVFAASYRPTSVLWDGTTLWALLEGHPADIAEQAARVGMHPVDGPPELPQGRGSVAPSCVGALTGTFVAEVGVGVVHGDAPPRAAVAPGAAEVGRRIKHELDPAGRLNPGVDLEADLGVGVG